MAGYVASLWAGFPLEPARLAAFTAAIGGSVLLVHLLRKPPKL